MALIKCKECGKEVSTKAKECPSCGAHLKSSSSNGCFTIIAVIFIFGIIWFFFIMNKSDKPITYSTTSSVPKADTPPFAVPEPVYDPTQKWGKEKVASAKKVMALANQNCQIYEEGPHLVVEMRMYITDPNQRLSYVKAIADADVILQGKPRNIYFYDPSNKKIAQADTLNGVRLID
jgi:hypothetical protein